MKKSIHKICAVVLTLVMAMSLLAFPAHATTYALAENEEDVAVASSVVSGVVYEWSAEVTAGKSTPVFTVDLLDGDDGSRGTISVGGAYLDGSSGDYTVEVYRYGVEKALYIGTFSADGEAHRNSQKFKLVDGGRYYINIYPEHEGKTMIVALGIGTV